MTDLLTWISRRAGIGAILLPAAVFCICTAVPDRMSPENRPASLDFYAGDTRCAASFSCLAEDRNIPGLPGPAASGGEWMETPGKTVPPSGGEDGMPVGPDEVGTDEKAAAEAQEEEEAARLSEAERLLRERLAADEDAYHIMVNRSQNTVTVYERDEGGAYTVPVRAMVCSTGSRTPLGAYQTSRKYEWRPLFGGVYGQYATRITGHILFHSVPYTEASKNALEYEEYNKLGTSASMGCIRLSVEDAKWLYDYCAVGTLVTIYEDEDPGPLGKPEPLVIDVDSPYRGWDPTDPDAANPWLASEAEKGSTDES